MNSPLLFTTSSQCFTRFLMPCWYKSSGFNSKNSSNQTLNCALELNETLRITFERNRKKWKSVGTKLGEYGGCGCTSQPYIWMASLVILTIWRWAVSCNERNLCYRLNPFSQIAVLSRSICWTQSFALTVWFRSNNS